MSVSIRIIIHWIDWMSIWVVEFREAISQPVPRSSIQSYVDARYELVELNRAHIHHMARKLRREGRISSVSPPRWLIWTQLVFPEEKTFTSEWGGISIVGTLYRPRIVMVFVLKYSLEVFASFSITVTSFRLTQKIGIPFPIFHISRYSFQFSDKYFAYHATHLFFTAVFPHDTTVIHFQWE